MAIPLNINGAIFEYPVNFDEDWGVEATGWAQAVTNGMLQMQGGNFPLTADVNFGPNFGLLSQYFETRSSLPATSGTVRLSSADAGIAFRNNANSGNLILTTNSSDQLLYNGHPIGSSGGGAVTSITGTAHQVIASSSTGDITLSTPQNIDTTSSPTFASLTLTSPLTIPNGGTGQITANAAYNALSPMTTAGDIEYEDATPKAARLPIGTAGKVLTVASGLPSWAAIDLTGVTTSLSGILPVADGGTGQSSYTNGQLLIGNTTGNTLAKATLTGTTNQVNVTNGAGSITLSTPQNIDSTATPTFASETLTATTNQLILGTTRTVTLSAAQPATSSRVYTIPDQGAAANIVGDQANYTIAGTWTMSNDVTYASSKGPILTDNTTNTVAIRATNSTTSWTFHLPPTAGSSNYFLQTDGSGNTTWQPGGSGTVGAGTSGQNAVYNGTNSITSGATMSMNSTKITSLANGTASTDAAAFGQIHTGIQAVVQATTTSTTTSGTGSYVNTNLSASITPTSSSNRIKITVSGLLSSSAPQNGNAFLTIARGSTNLAGANGFAQAIEGSVTTGTLYNNVGVTYIDSPATTSSTTYNIQIKGSTTNAAFPDNSCTGVITLEEIV